MTHHRRRGAAALLGAALTLVAVTTGLPATATGTTPKQTAGVSAPAASPEVLAVDFGQDTGAFRGGASGTLYGFGDEGAPTRALVNGAHITNSSQKPPFGTQHPSGDVIRIEGDFFAKHGKDLYVYIQDHYPDWPYYGGKRPGDTRTYDQATGTYTDQPNGVWDYLEVVELMATAIAEQADRPEDFVFIPFNEPDLMWYQDWTTMKDRFLQDWSDVHELIQRVYREHGLAPAQIGGPGDCCWRPQRAADFLDYGKAKDLLPDVWIWHELGIDNLRTFRSHLAEYRALEDSRGIADIPVNITEYGMLRDMGVPGQLIQWFSMFEDSKVDAQTAYWNYAGNFSDNSSGANGANGGWWLFKWYGDLEGSRTVRVTPPRLDAVDTLQGIGAVDRTARRATVLLGGTGAPVEVRATGLSRTIFGGRVDVEVREAKMTGAEGLSTTPPVVAAMDDVQVGRDGSLTVPIDTYDRYAAYQVLITPHAAGKVTVDGQPWRASIEAEEARLTGARTYQQDPQANGGWKFMASHGADIGSFNQPSSRLEWTVEVPRAGTYRLQVFGATPGKPGRHALFVDDAFDQMVQYRANLALTDTHRWQYRGSTQVDVTLTAGTHTLSLRASRDGSTLLPNADITLDRLELVDVSDGAPEEYPTSTMRPYGGARTGDDGGVRLGESARADLYVTAMETGYHDLTTTWRGSRAGRVDLAVNGRPAAALTSRGGGTWTSKVRVFLSRGINEVELTSPSGASVLGVGTVRAEAGDQAAVRLQAEDQPLGGGATVRTYADATGSNVDGGFVGNVGHGEGNYLEIPRAAGFDSPGAYEMEVEYANAELSGQHSYNPQVVDRRLDVAEAGRDGLAGHAYFRYTYAWESFAERTIPLDLATPDAPLRLFNPSAWAPDIDAVTIAPLTTGEVVTVAAPRRR